MKLVLRFAIILSIVLVFVLPFSAQSDLFTVTATVVNLRSGHGIEYPIVGQAFRGSIYSILAYSPTANWVQLDLANGTSAWAFIHLGEVARYNSNPSPTVNYGTGGAVVNAPSTVTVTSNNPASLGQGGGFAAPLVSNSSSVEVMSIEEFNSTVGVTASLRMRSTPSLSGNVVWIIPYGERAVPVARNRAGTWILVQYDGREGWVYFEYVAAPPSISLVDLPVR